MALKLKPNGKLALRAGKLTCTCCCPTTLPAIRAEHVTANVRGYGFFPFDQLNDSGIYPGVDNDDILTLYAKRVETFTAEYGYSGFVFIYPNVGPCAGGCLRYDLVFATTLAATITTDFGAIHTGVYSQTRSPDFGSPSGSTTNTTTVTGQEGCEYEETIDAPEDSDFGIGNTFYYSFTGADATGPTTRSGSYNNPALGGVGGGASCDRETYKSLNGVLDLTGDGTLSDGFTRADVVAVGLSALPAWPGTWGGSAASTRSVGMGAYGLFVAGAGFIDANVSKGRWQVAIPEDLVIGRTYHLIYLYRFTPASGPAVDGDEQTLEIIQTGSDEWTAIQVTPFPEANGSMVPVLLRWECPADE